MSLPNPFPFQNGKKATCVEMLQMILDGEATAEQREYFAQHMDHCMPCFRNYELDMAVKQLVKSKCCGDKAPEDLTREIRNRINQQQ